MTLWWLLQETKNQSHQSTKIWLMTCRLLGGFGERKLRIEQEEQDTPSDPENFEHLASAGFHPVMSKSKKKKMKQQAKNSHITLLNENIFLELQGLWKPSHKTGAEKPLP